VGAFSFKGKGTRSSTITGVGGRLQSTHLGRSARILRQLREEQKLMHTTHFQPTHERPVQPTTPFSFSQLARQRHFLLRPRLRRRSLLPRRHCRLQTAATTLRATSGCSAQRRGRNRRGCRQSPPAAAVHTGAARSRAQAQRRPAGEPAMSPRHNAAHSIASAGPAGELEMSRWDTLSGHRILPRLGGAASRTSSLSVRASGRHQSMLAVSVGAASTSPFLETTTTRPWRPSAPSWSIRPMMVFDLYAAVQFGAGGPRFSGHESQFGDGAAQFAGKDPGTHRFGSLSLLDMALAWRSPVL
jgi:hypothetical protein